MMTIEEMAAYIKTNAENSGMEQTVRALKLAADLHRGQFREGSEKLPYVVHPLTMACHAISLGFYDDNLISACLLHDVVRDGTVTVESLGMNQETADAIELLNDRDPDYEVGNHHKAEYFLRLRKSRTASLVKLFDRCHNVSTMIRGFSGDRVIEYINETKTYVMPLIEYLLEVYPEDNEALRLIGYHLVSVMEPLDNSQHASALLDSMHEALGSASWRVDYDSDFNITGVEWSDGMARMFGYDNREEFPNTYESFEKRIDPEDMNRLVEYTDSMIKSTENIMTYKYHARKKDGEYRWFRINSEIIRQGNGTPVSCLGVIQDVTDLEAAQNKLQADIDAMKGIHRAMGAGSWTVSFNSEGRVKNCDWDGKCRRLLGYGTDDYFDDSVAGWKTHVHPDDLKRVHESFMKALKDEASMKAMDGEYRLITKDGSTKWFHITGKLSRNESGRPDIMYGIMIASIMHDEMTGIFNRQAFELYASLYLKRFPDTEFAFVISDINDFKTINSIYGEKTGDEVLKLAARSCYNYTIGNNGLAGHYGADRFVTLIPVEHLPSAEELNRQIAKASKSVPVDNFQIKIGIYMYVDRSLSIRRICDRAMLAMKSIKKNTERNVAYYDGPLAQRHKHELMMESAFQNAIEDGEFTAFYQPKIDPYTGRISGAEALVRWRMRDGSFISPGEFIPIFEGDGHIEALDKYIFGLVVDLQKKRMNAGLPLLPVSVNMSRVTLHREGAVSYYAEMLKRSGISPELIPVEITESASVVNQQTEELTRSLKKYGFTLHMDDYGTGYSSLKNLGNLPFDVIKIDKSMVDDIGNARAEILLKHTIQAIHELGMAIVAEGVETAEQVEFLKNQGVESIQGYYYSRPVPQEDFEEMLAKDCRAGAGSGK